MNRYTKDNNFILDATGKQWPVDTPHPLPLPEGIEGRENGVDYLYYSGTIGKWTTYRTTTDTHWLIRRPLPPVPRPKTLEEQDEEAMRLAKDKIYGQDEGMFCCKCKEVWTAALDYERKRTGTEAGRE